MQKRTKLILLGVIVFFLFGLGLYFFLSPILEDRYVTQPPELPSNTTPILPKTKQRPPPGQAPSSTISELVVDDSAKLQMLVTKSMTVTERVYSGSNSDGFTGYSDVAEDFTQNGKNWLRSEQQKMQSAHPMSGTAYGVSARAVSSKLEAEALWSQSKISVTVQVFLREDNGKQYAKKLVWYYTKQEDGNFLIDSVDVSDLQL
ncbi:hypothetical protein IT408_03805 [Candidatus Uhrbacteria bacterium]|nr:hypothetical protein [Candidatus Uhrbacteria bacterium]